MKRIKVFYVTALLLSVVILYGFSITYFKPGYSRSGQEDFDTLDSGWSYLQDGELIFTDSLPRNVKADADSSATLYGILPDGLTGSDVLQFHTGHYNVWVYVDDALIYSNTAEGSALSKTTGNANHFVKLEPSMSGKPFSIVYQSCYPRTHLALNRILLGDNRDILYHLLISRLPAFIICALMFGIGCMGLLCYTVFHKKLSHSDTLLWLSLFALAFSSWSGFETQMMAVLLPYHIALSWITFVCLKLIPIPAIIVISQIYQPERSRLCNALIVLSGLDLILSSALQYTGVLDFRETLIFTHSIFFLSTIWIFSLTFSSLKKKLMQPEAPRPRALNRLHLLFVSVLTITIMLDFLSYYLRQAEDSARFSRIALLSYIIALAVMVVQRSLEMQRTSEKAQLLHELAATDPLTKLKNRASFEKELALIPRDKQSSYGVAMFDLNRLKYFNDVHGHSSGDYYIIICSEILQDIFCPYGSVYRIGGDEFCAIMKDVSCKKYEQLSALISARIDSLHQTMFEYHMEVADGYAAFDPALDKSLQHTMERADKAMYEKKKAMKTAAEAQTQTVTEHVC